MATKDRSLGLGLNLLLTTTILLLLLSWAPLLWAGEIITWSLAPYDTTPLELRPPQGTWQRDLSDFFQAPPGSLVPPILLLGISLALFGLALRRVPTTAAARVRLGLGFALSNLLFLVAVLASSFAVAGLPLELAPYPGYGWTFKFALPQFLLLTALVVLQAWSIPRHILLRHSL
jgi:hypothetical protein